MPKLPKITVLYSDFSVQVFKGKMKVYEGYNAVTPFDIIQILENLGLDVEYEEIEEEV